MKNIKNAKNRIPWTDAEVEKLKEGLKLGKKVEDIYIEGRTNLAKSNLVYVRGIHGLCTQSFLQPKAVEVTNLDCPKCKKKNVPHLHYADKSKWRCFCGNFISYIFI